MVTFACSVTAPRSHPKQRLHICKANEWVTASPRERLKNPPLLPVGNTGKDRGHFLTFFIALNHYKLNSVLGTGFRISSRAVLVLPNTFTHGYVMHEAEVSLCPPTHGEESWRLLIEHPHLFLACP